MRRNTTRFLRLSFTIATSIVLSACASPDVKRAEPTLEEKVAAEPPANEAGALAHRAATAFSTMDGITPAQKQKLMEIYANTYSEAEMIRTEIGKSKSLLFRTVGKKAYNSADVDRLKQRVVDLDHKRLVIMFKALAEVQAVIGYGEDKEPLYRHFEEFEKPRFGPIAH